MANHSLHFYLLKTCRVTAWLLLVLMIMYIVTGYAMAGRFGLNQWISAQDANLIHRIFDLPLISVFALHASISIYFALKRWGWIGQRANRVERPQETTPVN